MTTLNGSHGSSCRHPEENEIGPLPPGRRQRLRNSSCENSLDSIRKRIEPAQTRRPFPLWRRLLAKDGYELFPLSRRIGERAAQREIEGSLKSARTELQAFVAEQSVALAEGIIRREIRPEDNTRMVNEFIDDLSEVGR